MPGRTVGSGTVIGVAAVIAAMVGASVAIIKSQRTSAAQGPRASESLPEGTPEAALAQIESDLLNSPSLKIVNSTNPDDSSELRVNDTVIRVEKDGRLVHHGKTLCKGVPPGGFRVIEADRSVMLRLTVARPGAEDTITTKTVSRSSPISYRK